MDMDILDGIPEDEVEIIKSNKGGLKVIHKGYMYTVHKKRQCGGIRWRCAQRSLHCKGSISTGRDGPPKVNMPHNHLPDLHSVALARGRQSDDLIAFTQQIMDVKLEEQPSDADSMPLQERLVRNPLPLDRIGLVAAASGAASTSGGLKSQPLSPTKLKVTRQSFQQQQQQQQQQHQQQRIAPAPPKESQNEEMCLRWNSHHSNMQTAFPSILVKEQYVDVTLAAEGKTLKCHRLILSSCSPYFEEILSSISPMQHPVLFMKDIPFWILKSLCDFMYAGEVHIYQNKLEELLTVAEALKIKGLAGKSSTPTEKKKDDSVPPPRHNENPQQRPQQQQQPTKEELQRRRLQQYQQQQQIQLQQQQQRNSSNSNYQQMFDSTQDDDDILDPLELLAPMYEETAEEKKPPPTLIAPTPSTTITPTPMINLRPREALQKPFQTVYKKTPPMKKLRKRKLSEVREPSPPPVFSFRKGTRSRPNVKIPKYYTSEFGNTSKNSTSASANQSADPLLDEDEIKTEPIDVEDNMVEYGDDDHDHNYHELLPAMVPEIKMMVQGESEASPKFKRIRLVKPIISEVHSVKDAEVLGGLEVIPIAQNHKEPENAEPAESEADEAPPELVPEMDITENSLAEPDANATGKAGDGEKELETEGEEVEQAEEVAEKEGIEVEETEGTEVEETEGTEVEEEGGGKEVENETQNREVEDTEVETGKGQERSSSKELQQNEELGDTELDEDQEPDAITNDNGD